MSMGDAGPAAHAYSALSRESKDDAERPMRTRRSIDFAAAAAAVR